MYLLIIIFKKSEFMAAQRARPILLNERFLVIIYTVFPPLTARASIVFGGPFTRRLLETGAYSRQAFIFTCTIYLFFLGGSNNNYNGK